MLAPGRGPRPAGRCGERVKYKYKGDWWNGRIVEVAKDQARVRWIEPIAFDVLDDRGRSHAGTDVDQRQLAAPVY